MLSFGSLKEQIYMSLYRQTCEAFGEDTDSKRYVVPGLGNDENLSM
jgi:hypothetical protein